MGTHEDPSWGFAYGDRIHRVDALDARGGPWKRGYLRATWEISPDDWFFDGHFKNDPCMPGTLMFEGCLQALAFYLAGMGFTARRDGWRFHVWSCWWTRFGRLHTTVLRDYHRSGS